MCHLLALFMALLVIFGHCYTSNCPLRIIAVANNNITDITEHDEDDELLEPVIVDASCFTTLF